MNRIRTNRLLAILLLSLATARGAPAQDLAKLEAELRAAEIAFARSVEQRDFDTFRSMLHESATFGGGARVLRGRDQVAEAWRASFFAEGSPTLSWRPETVFVTADGELGLSTGPYQLTRVTPPGEPQILDGTFFSVWRRVGDGWKIVLDGGTPGQPRESPDDD